VILGRALSSRTVITEDADAVLRQLAADAAFKHRRAFCTLSGSVADDPHPCAMAEVVFFLAGWKRTWLNWVPMPTEAVCNSANYVGQ